jgi:hypothetical protein
MTENLEQIVARVASRFSLTSKLVSSNNTGIHFHFINTPHFQSLLSFASDLQGDYITLFIGNAEYVQRIDEVDGVETALSFLLGKYARYIRRINNDIAHMQEAMKNHGVETTMAIEFESNFFTLVIPNIDTLQLNTMLSIKNAELDRYTLSVDALRVENMTFANTLMDAFPDSAEINPSVVPSLPQSVNPHFDINLAFSVTGDAQSIVSVLNCIFIEQSPFLSLGEHLIKPNHDSSIAGFHKGKSRLS